jgi:hypothetical protein
MRLIGEAGPEAVVPLSVSKGAQRARVMRQAGLIGWADGGIAGWRNDTIGWGNGMTVNIYLPPGSDGDDVIAKIQRYERRNGKGWRSA